MDANWAPFATRRYAEKTLGHLHQLWVLLEALMKGKETLLSFGAHGFDAS